MLELATLALQSGGNSIALLTMLIFQMAHKKMAEELIKNNSAPIGMLCVTAIMWSKTSKL